MKWTKEINQIHSGAKQSSFLSSREDFIKLLKHGNLFLKCAIENLGTDNTVITNEAVFQNFDYLQKFVNSKILIVGAGPSLDNGYDASEYDYIWSCNSFYKNDKLNKHKIDLVTLGVEIDLRDDKLLDYISKNDTIVCFENKYIHPIEMKEFKNKYPEKVFWAMTRYHSRIGSIPRLACIAIFLGAKEIHFAGMDGYVPKSKNYDNSVFEPNKKATGTIEDAHNEDDIIRHYRDQYLAFWDYILHDIGKDVRFKNLGHQHPCNLSTDVLTSKLGINYEDYIYESRA
tara:strand:- start:2117 stop:2974 length:858 start_codon:yes stop_codon:yes gene_type:complete